MTIRNELLETLTKSQGALAAVFKGIAFQVGKNQTLSAGASTYFLVETGEIEIVLDPLNLTTNSGDLSFAIFEGGTASGGEALTIYNMDRNSIITQSAQRVELYSTVTTEGTQVTPIYNIIDDNNRSKSGQLFSKTPFILKPNTVYMLKLTHNETGARILNAYITAYRRDVE